MNISACILVKNEDEFLKECVINVSSFVDEIVIVNNGFEEIKLDSIPFNRTKIIHDYSKTMDTARNLYLKEASCDWIFVIDVDERIVPSKMLELKNTLQYMDENTMGCLLPRYDYIGEGKWATVPILRLFRNLDSINYNEVSIHATVMDSINEIGGKVITLSTPIHHFDFLHSNEYLLNKRIFYTDTLKREIDKNPSDFRLYRFLGLEYSARKMYRESEKYFLRATELKKGGDTLSQIFLAQQLLIQRDLARCSELVKAIEDKMDYFDERLQYLKAEIAVQNENIDLAFNLCVEMLHENPTAPHNLINIASLKLLRGESDQDEYLKKAVEMNNYLLDPIIFKEKVEPNIFIQQSLFLSTTNLFNKNSYSLE